MIAKSVGWTTGGPPSHLDPLESDTRNLGPDEVLVRIDARETSRTESCSSRCDEDPTPGSHEVCRGVAGRVMEAGANALWYVDRAVIVPADGRCANCDAGQRDRAAARFGEVIESDGDGTPARFIVVRANELCVVSTIVDWQKPISA
jgi:hypothetical protein